jgi:hypothetical protein
MPPSSGRSLTRGSKQKSGLLSWLSEPLGSLPRRAVLNPVSRLMSGLAYGRRSSAWLAETLNEFVNLLHPPNLTFHRQSLFSAISVRCCRNTSCE